MSDQYYWTIDGERVEEAQEKPPAAAMIEDGSFDVRNALERLSNFSAIQEESDRLYERIQQQTRLAETMQARTARWANYSGQYHDVTERDLAEALRAAQAIAEPTPPENPLYGIDWTAELTRTNNGFWTRPEIPATAITRTDNT